MNDTKVSKVWNEWENVKSYQALIGLSARLNENVNFFEGRQWASATEATKNLPRPIFNFIKMICRNKVSNILSKPVKVIYKAYDNKEGAEKFTRFAEYIQKEIRQDDFDSEAVNDGVKKGSYFYHYYWDAEAKGKKGRKEGGIRVELIDALNFGVSNPRELDVQKQKWVIIASREDAEAVKAMADDGIDKDMIKPDDNDNFYDNDKEQEGSDLCTVLTKYFRKDGEVYFTKAVKGTIVNKPTRLTPDIKEARKSLGLDVDNDGVDASTSTLPESEYEDTTSEYKATLFPVVAGTYERRENCIYGLSEVEGLIPNQKAVNFSIALKLLLEQNMAWGKFIAKEGALQDQEVTNEPGQVLTDYYKGGGQGFYNLPTPIISSAQLSMSQDIINLSRSLTGATEVMSGELASANMSGAAIAQLQSQAQLPVEELRKRYWDVKEQQGRILEQFFKLFYEDTEYVFSPEQNSIDQQEETDIFNGSEFADSQFSVVVEAVGGTKSSSAADIQILSDLAAKQIISPLAFVSTIPDDFISNKSELIKIVKAEEESKINTLTQAIQQATEKIKEDAQTIQAQEKLVDNAQSLINENRALKALLLETRQQPAMGMQNTQGTAYSPIAPTANNGDSQWMNQQ